MHSDIIGNVFVQGGGPGARYSILNLGGSAEDSPGTEGDFNIAHNLFVMDRYGAPSTDAPVYVQIHGNVDHVRMYNNGGY